MADKFRVRIEAQKRDFDSQDEAREWVKKILVAPIYFVKMIEI